MICLIILFIKWLCFNYNHLKSISYSGETAKLKYRTLCNFYHSNPKRWRYEQIVRTHFMHTKNYVKILLFNSGDNWKTDDFYDTYCDKNRIIRVQLSFIDYIRFLWDKTFTKNIPTKGMNMILEAVQEDIKVLSDIAQDNIEKAEKDMKDIELRLKGD